MSLSIHDTTVTTFKAMLGSLDRILSKAEAHAEARQFDPANLLSARLFPDMLDFTRQVQIACDLAKSGAARLAGIDPPKHEDTETTFAELHARIAKVIAFIASVDRTAVDASGERSIVVPLRDSTMEFKGSDYVNQWVLPNFYFHYSHAYALLRHNGVELGKRDFLGGS